MSNYGFLGLLIGGGVPKPAGIFSSVMDMLKTELFAEYGIKSIDFAGHPEGNPDDPDSDYHLLEKLNWTEIHSISSLDTIHLLLSHYCFF